MKERVREGAKMLLHRTLVQPPWMLHVDLLGTVPISSCGMRFAEPSLGQLRRPKLAATQRRSGSLGSNSCTAGIGGKVSR